VRDCVYAARYLDIRRAFSVRHAAHLFATLRITHCSACSFCGSVHARRTHRIFCFAAFHWRSVYSRGDRHAGMVCSVGLFLFSLVYFAIVRNGQAPAILRIANAPRAAAFATGPCYSAAGASLHLRMRLHIRCCAAVRGTVYSFACYHLKSNISASCCAVPERVMVQHHLNDLRLLHACTPVAQSRTPAHLFTCLPAPCCCGRMQNCWMARFALSVWVYFG